MVDIRVQGLRDLVANLDAMADEVKHLEAFTRIGETGAEYAKRFAPHRTGKLAQSITSSVADNRASVISSSPYAGFVNYGTKFIKADHYLQRADNAMQNDAINLIENNIDNLIDRRF